MGKETTYSVAAMVTNRETDQRSNDNDLMSKADGEAILEQ